MQDYLLPELESLRTSLALDMLSRTADKYTYYLSSLRDILRYFPDEWNSSTKAFVMCYPYAGPKEIISYLDKEILDNPYSDRVEVLVSVRALALSLIDIQDTIADSLRA